MADEKKGKGWLKTTFKWAAKGALVAASVLFGALVFDPTFLPIMHDVTNPVVQALQMKMGNLMGWLPYHLGLTGDGGLMHGFMQNYLADELAVLSVPSAQEFASIAPEALDFDY